MGQVASALQNPTTFESQPSGFSGAEWAARLGGMGLQGLNQGVQQYTQQNSQLRNRGGSGTGDMGSTGGNQNFYQPYMDQAQSGLNQATARKPNPYFMGYGGS